MASELDPFTQVYNALYELPWARAEMCKLVERGNRVTFSGRDRSPLKDQVNVSDLPELRLIPTGSTPHIQRTSSTSTWILRFEWQLATGDQRVNKFLYPVEFELLRAMANWIPTLQALTWKDKKFAWGAPVTEARTGVTETDINRGIRGWVALWTCEVRLALTTADLISED